MLGFAKISVLFFGLANCFRHARKPTVRVKNGTYYGVHSAAYNQDFFLGIPYAQPPVGELRFRNPVSLNETWKNGKEATQYSGEVRIPLDTIIRRINLTTVVLWVWHSTSVGLQAI